jgi:hypothetical protein
LKTLDLSFLHLLVYTYGTCSLFDWLTIILPARRAT